MKKQKLVQVIKAAVATNTIIPILESVSLRNDRLIVGDLQTQISLPYNSGIDAAVDCREFVKAIEMFETPVFSKNEFGITLTEGKRKVKLSVMENDGYPRAIPTDKEARLTSFGSLDEADVESIKTAMAFTSNDDLRPAMTGIFIHEEIAASDAHRLFWRKASVGFSTPAILTFEVAKLITMIGGSWTVTAVDAVDAEIGKKPEKDYVEFNKYIRLTNDDIQITTRTIDAKFPDYKQVIPQGIGNALLTVGYNELVTEIKNCIKFGNRTCHLVKFSLNGVTSLNSSDIDFGSEYDVTLETAKSVKRDDIQIAFNGKMLLEILAQQDHKKPVVFKLYSPTKAAIINNDFLIMPLMLPDTIEAGII